MKNNLVRTRYAPSPTGLFHIGGARTALFNYIFAKSCGGSFIVRIEDTDIDRNVNNGIDSQLKNLAWLKIFPDESINNPGLYGPYIQSEKLNRYRELVNLLLSENKAYRCFCKVGDLKKERKINLKTGQTIKYSGKCKKLSIQEIQNHLFKSDEFVIRLNILEKKYEWNDLIKGLISIPSFALSDIVILKSNGYPTYNFAVVVDDFDMDITHVLRGEEHISNTPYQIAIKEALNLDNDIQYGHLSVIVDIDGKKLSKRNMELKQFIEDYKNMGFSAKSIINYMCLLGWSPKDNEEFFSISKAISEFNLEDISSSPSTFDFKKMEWVSKLYFKKMEEIEYLDFVKPFINIDNTLYKENEKYCLLLFKDQISYAKELNDLINDILICNKPTEIQIKNCLIKKEIEGIRVINNFRLALKKIEDWRLDVIQFTIKDCEKDSKLKGKDFFSLLRFSSTFNDHGPELYKIIYILGKNTVSYNLKYFLDINTPKVKTINLSNVVK